MDRGLRFILCIVAIILIMIAERGVPIKLKEHDFIVYLITFISLLMMTEYLS